MSFKKTEKKDRKRFRKSLYHMRGQLVKCPSYKCQARNSPSAEVCWKCGGDMKRTDT